MIEINLRGTNLNVGTSDDGMRHMSFVDEPSGITIHVALPPDAAEEVARALSSSGLVVVPAHALPREIEH